MVILNVDTKGAADFLGVKDQTVRAWRRSGVVKIPFFRVGRAVRYRMADLEAFVERNRTTG